MSSNLYLAAERCLRCSEVEPKLQLAKRLRELEPENVRLKRLLAEAELDKAAMKEII